MSALDRPVQEAVSQAVAVLLGTIGWQLLATQALVRRLGLIGPYPVSR